MFKNILIPISSEFYSKGVLEKGAFLAKKFDSKITLIYIIEEKTLNQIDRLSDSHRTHVERVETKREIIKEQMNTAKSIIFNDARLYLTNRGVSVEEKAIKGEFSKVVKSELGKNNFDLILMGYEKGCLLNYRLLDEVDIPIWVETECDNHSILAVCSNLAPNKKVPEIGIKLSELLGWKLHILYVVDTQDSVEVDENGHRSDKKSTEDLISSGNIFIENIRKKGYEIQLVTGSLEKETIKAADKIGVNLVIVGREQKRHSTLGLPIRNVKRKIAEKCKYSILFVN